MTGQYQYTPVAITPVSGSYPERFPFDSDERYPEYPGREISPEPNPVYRSVRDLFRLLGYDRDRWGQPSWNPLGFLIQPGDRVFIKPNLVTHAHRHSSEGNGDLFSVITHPSVVRAVADYAVIALQGRGEIVIGDNPSVDADFERMMDVTRLDGLGRFYADNMGTHCRVLDLRPLRTPDLALYGFKSGTHRLSGDPEGNSVINLGRQSYLYGLRPFLHRGVFTDRMETMRHHRGEVQEYSLSNTILNSDVFISIPKLKTHHKVGATLNIKGLVGINANKNYLVHWRIGFPAWGGDEFPAPSRRLDYALVALRHLLIDALPESTYLRLRDRLRGTGLGVLFQDIQCLSFKAHRGAWEGNDTCWRMAADLYRLFVRDAAGSREGMNKSKMRFFSLVDGVTAGEADGPFSPISKSARILVAGEDLLLVDCVGARLMDFDISRIHYLKHLLADEGVDLGKIEVLFGEWPANGFFEPHKRYLQFKPPARWRNLSIEPGKEERT